MQNQLKEIAKDNIEWREKALEMIEENKQLNEELNKLLEYFKKMQDEN